MKKLIFLLLILYSYTVVSQTTITSVLDDFSILKVYNGIDIELVKSDKQEVVITGKKADKTKISNEKGVLKISMRFPETTADGTVKAILYYNKSIIIIDANEGATITSKGITQQKLNVKAQEGAFVNMVVDVKFLEVKSSSGGVIKLSGTAKNQTVNADLGGVYHGYNLKASDMTQVRAGSGAKAEVNASETLNVRATFGGNIFYKGTPEVLKEKKVIGGTIEQRN